MIWISVGLLVCVLCLLAVLCFAHAAAHGDRLLDEAHHNQERQAFSTRSQSNFLPHREGKSRLR